MHFRRRQERIGGIALNDLAVAHVQRAGKAKALVYRSNSALELFLIIERRWNQHIINAGAPAPLGFHKAGNYPFILSVPVPVRNADHIDFKLLRGMIDAETVGETLHAAVGQDGGGKCFAKIHIVRRIVLQHK